MKYSSKKEMKYSKGIIIKNMANGPSSLLDEIAVFFVLLFRNTKASFKKLFSKGASFQSKGLPGNLARDLSGTDKDKDKKEKPEEKEEVSGDKKSLKGELVSNVPGSQMEVWEYPPLSLLSNEGGGKAERGNLIRAQH